MHYVCIILAHTSSFSSLDVPLPRPARALKERGSQPAARWPASAGAGPVGVLVTKSCVGGGRGFSRESRKRDFANWRVLIAILTVNCIGLALIAKPTEEYRLQNIAAGKASGPPPIYRSNKHQSGPRAASAAAGRHRSPATGRPGPGDPATARQADGADGWTDGIQLPSSHGLPHRCRHDRAAPSRLAAASRPTCTRRPAAAAHRHPPPPPAVTAGHLPVVRPLLRRDEGCAAAVACHVQHVRVDGDNAMQRDR